MTLDRPGFADPAIESQACFRALLDAMSRPGTIVAAGPGLDPPEPLHRSTAAALLTLVDGDAPLWLDPALASAAGWVAFHCAAVAAPQHTAIFVCAASLPTLAGLHGGTNLAPEESATVILQAAAIGEGTGYVLSGPGIETTTMLRVAGLPDDFAAQWAVNGAGYPRGVDLVLSSGDRLCALPRTCQVRAG